jgi:hypothetical protein
MKLQIVFILKRWRLKHTRREIMISKRAFARKINCSLDARVFYSALNCSFGKIQTSPAEIMFFFTLLFAFVLRTLIIFSVLLHPACAATRIRHSDSEGRAADTGTASYVIKNPHHKQGRFTLSCRKIALHRNCVGGGGSRRTPLACIARGRPGSQLLYRKLYMT